MLYISRPERGEKVSRIPWESARTQWYYLPNVISYVRILASGYPAYLLVTGFSDPVQRWWAAFWFAIIALSDGLDGFIARKWKLTSEWGKVVDPLGDKILVAVTIVALCVAYFGQPSWWILVGSSLFFLLREVVLTIQISRANENVPSPTWSGKVKTALQMVMIVAWIAPIITDWGFVVAALTIAALIATLISWLDYYRAFVGKSSE